MKVAFYTTLLLIVMVFIDPSFANAENLKTPTGPVSVSVEEIRLTTKPTTQQAPLKTTDYIITLNNVPIPTGTDKLINEEKLTHVRGELSKALLLALGKVSGLRADLENHKFNEESVEASLKASYLLKLDSFEAFYNDRLAEVEFFITLEEIQTSAIAIKEYRDKIYTPSVEEIVQFIIVFYAQDVIKIANERYVSVLQDIQKLEDLGLLKDGFFADQKIEIEVLLANAQLFRNHAYNFIVTPPTQESKEVAHTTSQEEKEVVERVGPMGSGELLKASLSNIKATYDKLLEIKQSIKIELRIE